jgi:hypothetical protein
MSEEIRIGQHLIRVDPEDVITVMWVAHVPGKDAKAVYSEMNRIARDRARVFYVADLALVTTSDAESRKATTGI